MSLDQKNRMARLRTPLGDNTLVLSRFHAQEGISENFEISVDALSEEEDINLDSVIGHACVVTLNTYGDRKRYFNGILVAAQWTGIREGLYSYRLILRPWLWLLSHTTDCRFFQEMTAPDIIRKIFDDAGFSDFEFKTTQNYPSMEYCVQYRETDFAFVSRLMEEFGLYYYFKHTTDKHLLVICDAMSAHDPLPGGGELAFIPLTGAYVRERQHMHQWCSERRFRSGRFVVNDYDFEKPNTKIEAERQGNETYGKSRLEVYDYPSRYKEQSQGETFAKVRLDAEQAYDHRRLASGDAPCLAAGVKFTLKEHHRNSENVEYLAIRASHSISEQFYRATGGPTADKTSYQGSYVLVPTSRPFRAPLVTPKPVVHGIQTAKVVGEKGEEITVDKYGRIKVQFHWDRERKQSCWIRVAEVFAGGSWGGVFHPRIDQEVVVDFLEGDPDRPLVVGVVYNAANMVPYDLPGNKTISGWKTRSSKGGGGYNELIFEDKKGSEQVRMHAEKDHDVTILNKQTVTVGDKFKPATGSASHQTDVKNGDLVVDVVNGEIRVTAKVKIELKVGNSTLTIDPTGITLEAPTISVKAQAACVIQGLPVKIN
ncbi:type VI secretion system tip protein TssI/VgrG [Xanthobacter oligotrophicus]|uniref:type VI secretion system Vgr family protein n=1 Tax=Xanthobacter oligotrophicus TaxID=2607286 RepID=UPI001E4862A2|nr:type VI secretion system tip protein TssI/VgrG [Xanthobacter oligotrophicus]MCG5233955.1 type VI secretion system tip protein VgrG [Xanthobacter oligotrophicus]